MLELLRSAGDRHGFGISDRHHRNAHEETVQPCFVSTDDASRPESSHMNVALREDQPMRALLIRRPWIEMILDGQKTWEIRGARTSVRGRIGLIASSSGTVVGVCDLVDCVGPLTAEGFRKNAKKAGMSSNEATLGHYKNTFAWVLEDPRILKRPVPYQHPSGAVIWVRLDGRVEQEIQEQLAARRRR